MFNNNFGKVLRFSFIAPVILCTLLGLLLAYNGYNKPKISQQCVNVFTIQSDSFLSSGWACDTNIRYNSRKRRLDTSYYFTKN